MHNHYGSMASNLRIIRIYGSITLIVVIIIVILYNITIQIRKNAIDSQFGSCELSAKWMNKEEIDDLEHTVGLQGITREAVTIEIEKDQGTVNVVHV